MRGRRTLGRAAALGAAVVAGLAATGCAGLGGARAVQATAPGVVEVTMLDTLPLPDASLGRRARLLTAGTWAFRAPSPADTGPLPLGGRARLLEAGRRAFALPPREPVRLALGDDPLRYAGYDRRGVPNYVRRRFTDYERSLLRWAYGIDDPNRLWLPDSTPQATLRYDTRRVDGVVLVVRVGYPSARRPDETWDDFADRLALGPRHAVPRATPDAHRTHGSLDVLPPDARAAFASLLDAARAAGFRVALRETLRSPERQALLFSAADGRTYTATSAHMVGRAVDLQVGDGNLGREATRREWIAFRRWVLAQRTPTGGRYVLIGTPERTWDWPHVELEDDPVGFRSVEALLAGARQRADAAEATRVARGSAPAAGVGAGSATTGTSAP